MRNARLLMAEKGASEVIATRTLFTRDGNGRPTPVEIEFRRPVQQPTGEWGCVCSLRGLRDAGLNVKPRPIYGEDSAQALQLAMTFIDQMLMYSKDFAAGHLSWDLRGDAMKLQDFRGEARVRPRDKVRIVEIVRTVEVHVDWSIPCTLRIDVTKTDVGPEPYYSTRVWRSDSYRLLPTGEAMRRSSNGSDETILVEDPVFGRMNVAERTPEAAIDATITKIKWQLFSKHGGRAATTARKKRPSSKVRKKRRRSP